MVSCSFFLQSGIEKLLAWLGIEPTTLDLSFEGWNQPFAFTWD